MFTVAILDVDKFKAINDTCGHLTGDAVLKKIGEIFCKSGIFRNSDMMGRYGGDEFLIIPPNTSEKFAAVLLARFAGTLKKTEFKAKDHNLFAISVSIGIADYDPTDKIVDEIIDRADVALYFAKNHGMDICTFDEKMRNNPRRLSL